MAKYGGWTGKILRVNLTTGKISSEDTFAKYMQFLGAEGFGIKVMWDEVPAGTHPYAPENKIVCGAGPFNGTGIPHAGRSTYVSLLPDSPFYGVGSGHGSGHWGANLKLAGWDAVIVEGKAAKPVWICIQDENVSIRDASKLWGNGIYRTTAVIMEEIGSECASVAAIGQAGENMFGPAVILTDRSGSGQQGAIFGSKNLKAIGVRGTGSVKIACTGKELLDMIAYHTSLIGGTSGSMKPKYPQPWAEYYGGDWPNAKNVFWGGANPPIVTGVCDPHDVQSIAFRGPGTRWPWTAADMQYTMVRGASCFGCPQPCNQAVRYPKMTQYAPSDTIVNECGGISTTRDYYGKYSSIAGADGYAMGSWLADDYGLGDDYHYTTGDFSYIVDLHPEILKANLPEAEYKAFEPLLELRKKGDVKFIQELLRRFALREGELGKAFGLGSYELNKRWKLPPMEVQWKERGMGKAVAWNTTTWFAPHHFEGQQVGYILNSMYNRDPCMHEQTHFNDIAAEVDPKVFEAVGLVNRADAIDKDGNTGPITEGKILLAKRLSADGVIHNSLVTCNRSGGSFFSPLKERGYKGDSAIDAKEYSLITGDKMTEEQFHQVGLRIFTLMRASTIRSMGTKNMRAGHDKFPDSAFDHPDWKDKPAFTPGVQRMDRADMEKALDMYYAAMGWDKNGAPTKETYQKLGLDDVADQLAKLNLL